MRQDNHAQSAAKREKRGFAKAVWVQRRYRNAAKPVPSPHFLLPSETQRWYYSIPMLATWNSASAAITFAKSTRREPHSVFVCC